MSVNDELHPTVANLPRSLRLKDVVCPQNIKQMLKSEHRESWLLAIQIELEKLRNNNTFQYVNTIPNGVRLIGHRFVFTLKGLTSNEISAFAARMVLKGYMQREGLEFNPNATYSGVVQHSTVLGIVAKAAYEGMHLMTWDAAAAFLSQSIDCDIYMGIPYWPYWFLLTS